MDDAFFALRQLFDILAGSDPFSSRWDSEQGFPPVELSDRDQALFAADPTLADVKRQRELSPAEEALLIHRPGAPWFPAGSVHFADSKMAYYLRLRDWVRQGQPALQVNRFSPLNTREPGQDYVVSSVQETKIYRREKQQVYTKTTRTVRHKDGTESTTVEETTTNIAPDEP